MQSILDGRELVTRSPHPFFTNPAIRAIGNNQEHDDL